MECGETKCLFTKLALLAEETSELERCIEKNDFVYGKCMIDTEAESNHQLKDIVFQQVSLSCNNPVEHQYYNPVGNGKNTSGKWLQFQTKDICTIYCTEEDLLKHKDIKAKVNCKGKKCLPMSKHCFENDPTPILYVSRNQQEAKKRKNDDKAPKK